MVGMGIIPEQEKVGKKKFGFRYLRLFLPNSSSSFPLFLLLLRFLILLLLRLCLLLLLLFLNPT